MEELLEEIVAEDSASLLRVAWALTGSVDQARDLVQDCLVKVAVQWRKVARAEHRSAYVRVILLNTWHDQRRRRAVRTVPLNEEQSAGMSTASDAVDDRQMLVKAMADLSPQQRRIVALRFLDDQTAESTAQILGCTPGTVRTQTYRALRSLRSHPQLVPLVPEPEVSS